MEVLTKNPYSVKYSYSGCGIELDSSLLCFVLGKNLVIFVAENSSSVHADKGRKNILVLGEGSTQRLADALITAEAKYSTNFSRLPKKLFRSAL